MNYIFNQFKKEIKLRFFFNVVYLCICFIILFEYLNEFFFLCNLFLFSNKFHFFFIKSPVNIYIFTFQILLFFILLILLWTLIIELFEISKYIYIIKFQKLKIIKNNYKLITITGLITSKEINFDILEYLNFEYQKFNNLSFLNIYFQSTIEITIIFYYFISIYLFCVFILVILNNIKKKIQALTLLFLMLILILPPILTLQLTIFVKFFFIFEIYNIFVILKTQLQEEWDSNP